MSKVKYGKINKREKYQIISDLYEIISKLNSKKEVVDLFVGLLTPSENLMIARRIQIGKKIIEGKSYEKIRKELNVGFDTIAKTENWINGGSEEYSKWIEKMLRKSINENNTKESYKSLLDKYPGHKILKELLK